MLRSDLRASLIPLGLACLLAPILFSTQTAVAAEGQWKPSQIAEVHERAKQMGLELEASALWDPAGDEKTGGLMRASVNVGGCSAAFVSAEGLIATNHHCAYGALQANSSVEHDYLKDGFLAQTRAEELPARGRSVRMLRSITDVSEKIRDRLDGVEDDLARARAYDQIRNELVDACEAASEFHSCRVASFFGGSSFELHEYIELRDLRLVYAPPSAIGEYGGETDNWMWPRHTGDFALLRAYAGPEGAPAAHAQDNVPYVPSQWLRPSSAGVNPGDFVAILGYPGKTERYLWAAELERHHQQWLPMRVAIYGEWIEILEAGAQRDEAVGIKVAALEKSLANRHKNAAGKVAGLDHSNFVATRRAEDQRLLTRDDQALATLEALAGISAARRERAARAFLLDNLRYAPRSLAIARDLATWAQQRAKPNLERKAGYRDRDRARVLDRMQQRTKDYDPEVDLELLASFMAHADMLDEGQRIAGFDAILGPARGQGGVPPKRDGVRGPPGVYLAAAAVVIEDTALADAEILEQLFEDPSKVAASDDPMLALARGLLEDIDGLGRVKNTERGRLLELGPQYFELLGQMRGQARGRTLYSDANSTLRLSMATVQGYAKWNDEQQAHQTVVAGAVAKHQGGGDFDLPGAVIDAAKGASHSRWIDAELGDVPVAFLADADTTGGNSGSPVVDAQGRLVGFNFDRVWENVAGDYVWRASHSRNVSVDVRYLYWMLDEVAGAQHLLKELGVADFQGPPAAAAAEGKSSDDPAEAATPPVSVSPASKGAGGCGCVVDERPGAPAWLIFVLAGLGLRRKRGRT